MVNFYYFILKLVLGRHPNGTCCQKLLPSFIPSPLPLPMHDMLLKHLTLLPCQKGKNGATVRSWAVLEADAFLCLAAQGTEGQRGEIRESQAREGSDLCKTLWNAPSDREHLRVWGRESVLGLGMGKQEFAHFVWQITIRKSLAAWVLSFLLSSKSGVE